MLEHTQEFMCLSNVDLLHVSTSQEPFFAQDFGQKLDHCSVPTPLRNPRKVIHSSMCRAQTFRPHLSAWGNHWGCTRRQTKSFSFCLKELGIDRKARVEPCKSSASKSPSTISRLWKFPARRKQMTHFHLTRPNWLASFWKSGKDSRARMPCCSRGWLETQPLLGLVVQQTVVGYGRVITRCQSRATSPRKLGVDFQQTFCQAQCQVSHSYTC